MKDYNYYNTFITIAPDSTAEQARIPQAKAGKRTIPVIEYELLSAHPYELKQDEVLFRTYIEHKFSDEKLDESEMATLREDFFSKPHPCLRCSSLAKTYGWGLHFDKEGKIALVPVESDEYQQLSQDKDIDQYSAMRSKR